MKIEDLFKGKSGKTVIGQKPNWVISVAGIAWLVGFLVNDGAVHNLARLIFYVFLGYWSYLEITTGVNTFRKIMGSIVALWIVYSLVVNSSYF